MPSSSPAPFFPTPPGEYNRQYMAQLVRAFSVFVQQANNPGDAIFTTLRLTALPIYANNAAALAGGLIAGDVYKTSGGELRIVV
ncbi:hypothetical protein UFOVP858_75 [uncultured Caudovirales phage]|uniref:Uncharacterized protein n=1 Tax=uncultured Caudovirales phage TaxID=2100421 RepID=A0A6J5PFM1_9CAUD|nr:hypothetical protein UFOVP858_75 [uncultured Caudovirales phage]